MKQKLLAKIREISKINDKTFLTKTLFFVLEW